MASRSLLMENGNDDVEAGLARNIVWRAAKETCGDMPFLESRASLVASGGIGGGRNNGIRLARGDRLVTRNGSSITSAAPS